MWGIITLATLAIAGVLLTYFLGMLDRRAKRINKQLENSINAKHEQLANLENEYDQREYDTSMNMPKSVVAVLDIYEDSNIKIPLDILEDISRMRLFEEEDILNYVETQRQHWKLENSKRLYNKKVKK